MPFILIIILLILFGGVSGCTTQSQNRFEDIPVVEAYLKQGEPISLKISQQIAIGGDVVKQSLDNLDIKFYENDEIISLQSQGNGTYKSNAQTLVKANKTYKMSFEYNGNITSAYTTIPSEPVDFTQSATSVKAFNPNNIGGGMGGGGFSIPTNLKLEWKNNDNGYYVVVIENIENSPELINTSTEGGNLSRAFRITPTQTNNTEIRPMQFVYYGNHKLYLYHIQADYALLYNSGSNTSQNLYTPTTSITNGVGIFTGMSGKTLDLNVYK